MYCHKCHKQSPENFVNCAYCGAKLKSPKKKEPSKFQLKKGKRIDFSLKTLLQILSVFASVLCLVAIVASLFTASKPERVVKSFVNAVDHYDENLYFSLFDENIIKYKQENRYFAEDETFTQMVLPVSESDAFYKEKCGEGFKLSYNVKGSTSLSEKDVQAFCKMLVSDFNYIKLPTKVEILQIEIVAKGEKGEYKSVYNDFWCMKIKGRWYLVDKTVYSEYNSRK